MDLHAREKAISMRKLHSKLAMYYMIRGTKFIVCPVKVSRHFSLPGCCMDSTAAGVWCSADCPAEEIPQEKLLGHVGFARDFSLAVSLEELQDSLLPSGNNGTIIMTSKWGCLTSPTQIADFLLLPLRLVPVSTTVRKTLLLTFLLSTSAKPTGTNYKLWESYLQRCSSEQPCILFKIGLLLLPHPDEKSSGMKAP